MSAPFEQIKLSGSAWAEDVNRVQQNVAKWAAAFGAGLSVKDIASSATKPTYLVSDGDEFLIADARGGPLKIVLPVPTANQTVTVRNAYATANAMTVIRTDGKAMGGGAKSVTIAPGQSVSAVCDGLQWWLSAFGDSGPSDVPDVRPIPGPVPPPAPPPPTNARYWLSAANLALPMAVDMGALGAGVLQQTVTGGIAAPVAVAIPEHAVLFGGPAGLIDYDAATFYFDKAAVALGVGAPPSVDTIVSAIKDVNGPATIFAANTSGGSNATADLVVQAVSAVRGVPPYLGLGAFGAGYVGDPLARPFWVAGGAVIGYAGNELLNIDLQNPTPGVGIDPDLVVSVRGMTGDQEEAFRLFYDGTVAAKLSLGAGGLVYADTPTGILGLVTSGGGWSLVGGVLTVTGSGGTVTGVTATAPVYSSGGAAPNITLGYDAVSLVMDGFGNLIRSALTGVVTAPGGSNTTSFAAIAASSVLANATGASASPGAFVATTVGDVLWKSGAGLAWGPIPVASVTGAVPTTRTLATTLPLRIDGGASADLSADRTLTILYDATSITLNGSNQIQRAALTGVIDAAAGSNSTSFAAISARSVLANATGASASPGAFPAPNSGDVLWRNGAGLAWSAIPVTSVTGAQPTITWPAATRILVSTGTSSDPTGEAAFTYDTSTNLFRLDGFQGIGVDPGTIGDGKYVLAVTGNASQDRIYMNPGGIQLTASGNYAYFHVDPASTAIQSSVALTLGLLATMRVEAMTWTGGAFGPTIAEATTLYIDGPPVDGSAVPALKTALHVAAGTVRFDGRVEWNMGSAITGAGSSAISFGSDGNSHVVSGFTTVTGVTAGASTRPGEVQVVEFGSGMTVKHNGAGGGAMGFDLSGDVDFVAATGDTLTVYNNGSFWKEIGRSLA